jgi:type VI secretion system protein ImpF
MQRFRPSLLDRLLDDSPGSPGGVERQLVSVDAFKDSVARDLEYLLNTRRSLPGGPGRDGGAVGNSVVAFGLDDFSSLSVDSSADRERICTAIMASIRSHEMRLRSVTVSLVADSGQRQRLRFAIRALLVMHPLSEPVNFDAVLQTSTQHYTVSQSRRAA